MRQLPQVVSGTRDLIENDRLSVLTASFDSDKTALLNVIDEFDIDYPVIWFNRDPNRGNVAEWNVHGIPTTVLINPQGEIVADLHAEENFQQVLEYFIDNGEAAGVISLDGSMSLQENGSVSVDVSMYSSQHSPLDVRVEAFTISFVYDKDDPSRIVDREFSPLGDNEIFTQWVQQFPHFADESHQLKLEGFGDADAVYVIVSTIYPGSEHLNEGEGIRVDYVDNVMLRQ